MMDGQTAEPNRVWLLKYPINIFIKKKIDGALHYSLVFIDIISLTNKTCCCLLSFIYKRYINYPFVYPKQRDKI